jgi:hypothetical protein
VVGGNPLRPPFNAFLAQPFLNYNMAHGWYLTELAASERADRGPLQPNTPNRHAELAIADQCRASVPGQMTRRPDAQRDVAFLISIGLL